MRLVRRVLVLVIGEQETDGLVSIFFLLEMKSCLDSWFVLEMIQSHYVLSRGLKKKLIPT